MKKSLLNIIGLAPFVCLLLPLPCSNLVASAEPAWDIKITSPENGAQKGLNFTVTGKYAITIPDDYAVCVRLYAGDPKEPVSSYVNPWWVECFSGSRSGSFSCKSRVEGQLRQGPLRLAATITIGIPRTGTPSLKDFTTYVADTVQVDWKWSNDPAPATTGTLSIKSTPVGASVSIDGKSGGTTGTAPLIITGLTEGAHSVAITKKGYTDSVRLVTIAAGKTREITEILEPLAAVPTVALFSATIPGDKVKAKPGETIILEWRVSGADSVKIDKLGTVAPVSSGKIETIPQEKDIISTGVLNAPGDTLAYLVYYTLYADSSAGSATKTVQVGIEPLTFEEIFKEYEKWGNKGIKWPDGTYDDKALVGPGLRGATTNLWATTAWLTGTPSQYNRYDCVAMQYKTLVFLNQMKTQGKLFGWNYMPVSGASLPYPEHQAVVVWQAGKTWMTGGEILDPHGAQKPAHYGAASGWAGFFPWQPDEAYSEVYPDIPGGDAARNNKYQFNEFDSNDAGGDGRWDNGKGAKTPWEGKTWRQRLGDSVRWFYGIDNMEKKALMAIQCPVDVLITNSSGKRLGVLPGGKWISDFQSIDLYVSQDNQGDKQWFFTLPDDNYTVNITGTGSGKYSVLAYNGEETVQDYGENTVTSGQKMVLNMRQGQGSSLTLADGSRVTPRNISIKSYVQSPGQLNFTLILIIIVVIAALSSIIFVARAIRRRAFCHTTLPITPTILQPNITSPADVIPQGKPAVAQTMFPEEQQAESATAGISPPVNMPVFTGEIPALMGKGKIETNSTITENVQATATGGATCTQCGGTNPASAEICKKCGSRLGNLHPVPPDTKRAKSTCRHCGAANRIDAVRCSQCGSKLESAPKSKLCPKCGDPIAENEECCNMCGRDLTQAA